MMKSKGESYSTSRPFHRLEDVKKEKKAEQNNQHLGELPLCLSVSLGDWLAAQIK